MAAEQSLFIGGRWTPSESVRTYEALDPFTARVATRAAAATPADVDRAVGAAQDAFGPWAALPPGSRREHLLAAADTVEARASELSEAITTEMGDLAAWGRYNVKVLAEKLRFAAGAAYQGLTSEVISSDNPGRTMIAIRRPAGVVACLVPWNAPVLLVGASVPAALVTGNTVVIKASEQTPRTHGLVAASHLKRVVLELSGEAPCIILADADLDRAVSAAAFGSFGNSGQGCFSTERIIVERPIAAEFYRRLATAAGTIVYGDPRNEATVLGPVINGAAIRRLSELVEDAVASGAQLLAGGRAEGPCFAPTVLSGVTPAMRGYREESFGPLASVVVVDGPEEALRVADDNEYGLSSSISSRDVTLALDLAKRLDVGMSHINDATLDDEAQIPFGSVRDSGYGRSGGVVGIEGFTELQSITIEGLRTTRYPISEWALFDRARGDGNLGDARSSFAVD